MPLTELVHAGVINSRSSVHRPPNSAKGVYTGAGQGSIQHDLELLAVVRRPCALRASLSLSLSYTLRWAVSHY